MEISIWKGEVSFIFRSEKFYSHYMSRMLELLKAAVPSLTGVVGSRTGSAWSVTNVVKEHDSYLA